MTMIDHKRDIKLLETAGLLPIEEFLDNGQKSADRKLGAFVIIEKAIATIMGTWDYVKSNVYAPNIFDLSQYIQPSTIKPLNS
jgi:hypothetical protein